MAWYREHSSYKGEMLFYSEQQKKLSMTLVTLFCAVSLPDVTVTPVTHILLSRVSAE